MKKLLFGLSAIVVILGGCSVEQKNQIEPILQEFESKNVPDKREVVFDIQPVEEQGNIILKGETSSLALKEQLLEELTSFEYTDSIAVLPDTSLENKTFAIVTVPVANLRGAPANSAELVTQAILGTPVKLLKKQGGWYYIQTPDKYISWVDNQTISTFTQEEFENWNNSDRVIFKEINGSVYSDEKLSQPVSDVTIGCILEKIGENKTVFEVQFPDGRKGFVSAQGWDDFSLFKKNITTDRENIISLAKQLSGRAYLWGGTSANQMDCSGFVKTVYFINGVILARDASLQALHGKDVEMDELEAGDLLFFGKNRVTHVGLSLGGLNFIHESGIVKQNSFDPVSEIYSEYRKNSFIKAKRVIGFDDEGIQQIKEHPWY